MSSSSADYMKAIKPFDASRLACQHCGETLAMPDLLEGLAVLEHRLGRAITILSGYRCKPAAEASGSAASWHAAGGAADLSVPGMTARKLFDECSRVAAFRGRGLDTERGFVHVDVRSAPARWVYHSGRVTLWID
jgi:uncharacterized protein YcbK (DUF882 family)